MPAQLVAAGLPRSSSRTTLLPVLQAVLQQGHDVLLSEPDVVRARAPPFRRGLSHGRRPQVWLRDPELYLAVYDMLAADVLVASECRFHFTTRVTADPRTSVSREPLDWPLSLSILLLRPSTHGLALLKMWQEKVASAAAPAVGDGSKLLVRTLSELLLDRTCGAATCAGEAPAGALPVACADARLGQCGTFSSLRVPSLSPIPGGDWGKAFAEDLFPRYPPRVNDGTQAMPYRVGRAAFPPEGLGLGLLPVGLFTSVHTYFVSNIPDSYRLKPYTVHAEAAAGSPGGVAAAAARLREAALWGMDSDAFYAAPQLLQLRLVVPPRLLGVEGKGEQELLVAHRLLMSWQLERLAEGVAAAAALGRRLVQPRLLCLCDAGQEGGACTSGELPPPPFACAPAAALRDSQLPAEDGLLPSSFLEHPRFRALERNASLVAALRPCDGGKASTTTGGTESLPPCLGAGGSLAEVEGGVGPAELAAGGAAGLGGKADGLWLLTLELRGPLEVRGMPGGAAATEAFNLRFSQAARYPVEGLKA